MFKIYGLNSDRSPVILLIAYDGHGGTRLLDVVTAPSWQSLEITANFYYPDAILQGHNIALEIA